MKSIDIKTLARIKKLIMDIGFISSHNHTDGSNFRFQDSIIRTDLLIDRAIQLGYKGVCITDHECISNHIKALTYMKALKEKDKEKNTSVVPVDFKVGLGNEIYLIDNLTDVTENYVSGVTKYWHFILIAKDAIGHEQLRQISSESAWKNYFRQLGTERAPTIKSELVDIIGENRGHLIASSACLGGELPDLCIQYFKNKNIEAKTKIHRFINWCIGVFGKDNFFLELQPASNNKEETEQSSNQKFVNQCLVKLAKAYGLKYTVTTDSHYLKKEHREIHDAYLNSDDNKANRELGDFYETTYLMSIEELINTLANHLSEDEVIEAFNGSMKMYSLIESYDLSHSVIVPRDKKIPKFKLNHLFKDWYGENEYLNKFANSQDEQEQYFLYLCEIGFIEKKQEFNEENISRINLEMQEVWEVSEKIGMRLAAYYVLVRGLIIEIMWKVSYVGVARGSITGFYTAYLMGITQLNPIIHKLPHWRHLSSQRPELPDYEIVIIFY